MEEEYDHETMPWERTYGGGSMTMRESDFLNVLLLLHYSDLLC